MSLTLWPAHGGQGCAAEVLAGFAREYRIIHSNAQVVARLAVMLRGIGAPAGLVLHTGNPQALGAALSPLGLAHADEVQRFHACDLAMLEEYVELDRRCRQAGPGTDSGLDQAFREQMWRWFERRVVVVDDYHASGDAIVAAIRDATPPGFDNRIMGLQNIKGTGLDFVYRWLAWDTCHRACSELLSRDASVQRHGLAALSAFQEFGLLCEGEALAAIAALRETPFGQQESVRAELNAIESRLKERLIAVKSGIGVSHSHGWTDRLVDAVEAFLDAGDAVRRRKRADRIYEDLVSRRISESRAALELQELTRRQKGGWLAKALAGMVKHVRRPAAAKPLREPDRLERSLKKAA